MAQYYLISKLWTKQAALRTTKSFTSTTSVRVSNIDAAPDPGATAVELDSALVVVVFAPNPPPNVVVVVTLGPVPTAVVSTDPATVDAVVPLASGPVPTVVVVPLAPGPASNVVVVTPVLGPSLLSL